MTLAPGVVFYPEEHEYLYRGKKLSGVTGRIAGELKLKMPEEFIGEHQVEGLHVHKAVQKWIESGVSGSLHPGVCWLTDTFMARYPEQPYGIFSEVLVSDFKKFASAVDIVVSYDETGKDLDIYDIKKGVFKRDYVSWQLGIYKYFIERYADRRVVSCTCICVKDREYYPIIPERPDRVERLLYGKAVCPK
jgi:hypothetical protein